ncbi:MAG: hypothetical protein VX874_07455 [Pseudomonadota bacterium]|nr:hypothetical protein [Pseudomonadota bacterium]
MSNIDLNIERSAALEGRNLLRATEGGVAVARWHDIECFELLGAVVGWSSQSDMHEFVLKRIATL